MPKSIDKSNHPLLAERAAGNPLDTSGVVSLRSDKGRRLSVLSLAPPFASRSVVDLPEISRARMEQLQRMTLDPTSNVLTVEVTDSQRGRTCVYFPADTVDDYVAKVRGLLNALNEETASGLLSQNSLVLINAVEIHTAALERDLATPEPDDFPEPPDENHPDRSGGVATAATELLKSQHTAL